MVNRTTQPKVNPIEQIDIIEAEKYILSNGIPVYYINAGSQDVIKIDFVFEAGTWLQPLNLVSSISNSMLEEGSVDYTAAEIAERFDFYGAYLQLMVDQSSGYVNIVSLGKHLPAILDITENIIKHPVFPQYELEVMIEKNKQKFLLENEKVRTLCQKKFTQVLFGTEHPYAIKNKLKDFDLINREILLQFYQSYYHSGNCRIILAGKVDESVLKMLEERFGGNDWKGEAHKKIDFTINPNPHKYHFVQKDNALQSAIRVGKFWVDKSHTDYHALSILVTILGGYFGSRLMANIREEKGYTYGIGSFVLPLKHACYLIISTEVGNEYVDPTLKEITNELQKLQNELVSVDELETVKSYLLGEFLRDFDGPFALSGSFKAINDFELDYTFYHHYLKVLRGITPEEIKQLAQKYLDPDDFYTVVAGSMV